VLAFPPARAHRLHFVFSLLDYLLSNNYVNSIIVHKFDFSDEEIMAYYISFLKTLSLKLNNHTVHFFYNEVSGAQQVYVSS
jgi:protein CLEC16A